MGKYQLLVLTNPVEGREDEYNKWYTEQHVHDVVKAPGFTSAQRFKVKNDAAYRYLAIYDMECDDPVATFSALEALGGTDAMPISDALDMADVQTIIYEPLTGKVLG